MKSPFPGMDPYIEEKANLWGDFRFSMISAIKRAVADALPERYVVRTAVRSFAHHGPTDEPVEESFIRIYLPGPPYEMVTHIEIPSPLNKQARTLGWQAYQVQRGEVLRGKAHWVELDLLRHGHRDEMLARIPHSPYVVSVSQYERRPNFEAWPAHFRNPLPTIPIPLRTPDPPLIVSLQPLVDKIYQESHYDRDIDYTLPLTPPLTAEESAWLADQLRQRA